MFITIITVAKYVAKIEKKAILEVGKKKSGFHFWLSISIFCNPAVILLLALLSSFC